MKSRSHEIKHLCTYYQSLIKDPPKEVQTVIQDIPSVIPKDVIQADNSKPTDTSEDEEFKSTVYDVETVFNLGQFVYLRINSQFSLLQKRMTTLKLTFEQFKHIEEPSSAIISWIEDFPENKPVKDLQDLNDRMQTPNVCANPNVCADIRICF